MGKHMFVSRWVWVTTGMQAGAFCMQPPLCRALQNPSCPLELADEGPGRGGVTEGPIGHFARPTAVREAQPLVLHPDLFVAGETPACRVLPCSAALSPLIL